MYVIRDIMYCKPGKVRPMVEKFLAMSKLGEKMGMPRQRIMTDFCAEQYWTVVSEIEGVSRSRRSREAGDLQARGVGS